MYFPYPLDHDLAGPQDSTRGCRNMYRPDSQNRRKHMIEGLGSDPPMVEGGPQDSTIPGYSAEGGAVGGGCSGLG